MLRILAVSLMLGVFASLSGCVSSPAGLAASTLPLTSKDNYVIVVRNISESTSTTYLLGCIPLGLTPSAYDLIQDIKKKYNADGMINVAADNRYSFYFVVTVEKTILSGDVIKFSRINGADVN